MFKVCKNKGDSSLQYLKLILREHKGNPHVPQIHHLQIYPKWYFVKMERLQPANDMVERAHEKMRAYIFGCEPDFDAYKPGSVNKLMRAHRMGTIDPLRTLGASIKTLIDQGYGPDLHGDNYMRRGDTYVLTDPIAGKNRTDRKRYRRNISNA